MVSKKIEIKKLIDKGISFSKIVKIVGVSQQYVWQQTKKGKKYNKKYQREYHSYYRKTDKQKKWRSDYFKNSKNYRKWREDNAERIKEIQKKYTKTSEHFKEHMKEYMRKYAQTPKRKRYIIERDERIRQIKGNIFAISD